MLHTLLFFDAVYARCCYATSYLILQRRVVIRHAADIRFRCSPRPAGRTAIDIYLLSPCLRLIIAAFHYFFHY